MSIVWAMLSFLAAVACLVNAGFAVANGVFSGFVVMLVAAGLLALLACFFAKEHAAEELERAFRLHELMEAAEKDEGDTKCS